jgi:hypothetical protein
LVLNNKIKNVDKMEGKYKCVKSALLPNGMRIREGDIVDIVVDVPYINNAPLPGLTQGTFLEWFKYNRSSFFRKIDK